MQITVQMLDGSVTPFKVRSSITIASLKAKFEPWQPMKGRALLHHDVQLDDRATLGSVPGVKDGTILRVDKHVSQVKRNMTGKKMVTSGPASSVADEDVVESIERSGDDEETLSGNERRVSSSKRKRPMRTSTTGVDDFIDDDNIATSPRGKPLRPAEIGEDPLSTADTDLSNSAMTLRIARRKKRESTAREQVDIIASDAQRLSHRLQPLKNIFASPPENPIGSLTASAHMPKATDAVSSHQDAMEDDDAIFLAGIDTAAAGTGPWEDFLARQCDACGRACGCNGDSLATLNRVVPVEERTRGQQAASTNINGKGYLMSKKPSDSQPAESGWTGM